MNKIPCIECISLAMCVNRMCIGNYLIAEYLDGCSILHNLLVNLNDSQCRDVYAVLCEYFEKTTYYMTKKDWEMWDKAKKDLKRYKKEYEERCAM